MGWCTATASGGGPPSPKARTTRSRSTRSDNGHPVGRPGDTILRAGHSRLSASGGRHMGQRPPPRTNGRPPMDDIPTSPEEALFAAGKGANETADTAMDYSEKVMGVAAAFGGEEAAAAFLAGTGAELGAGAAAAGGATIGAAVVGSFAAGYGIGTK